MESAGKECRVIAALVLVALGAAAGCRRQPALSVRELAAGLRRRGIAYSTEETAALPRVRAPGLRLRGPDLQVELYRIDDEQQMKAASAAARMAEAASRTAAAVQPLKAYVRGPFLVIVRREPRPGQVAGALDQVLGE